MNKSILITLIIVTAFFISCRGDLKNQPDGRVDPNVEMDLGPDNIGDQHFVDDDGYDDYDYDLNNYWDENEFRQAYEQEQRLRIPVKDEDDDGNFNLNEFSKTTFEIADKDNNTSLNEYEWDIAWTHMFNDYLEKDQFQTFDIDDDSKLELQDWQNVVANSGWFDAIDEDGDAQVQLEEWLKYLFNQWDYDNNGELTRSELQLYLPYYAASNS